jgi:hypothetical protein
MQSATHTGNVVVNDLGRRTSDVGPIDRYIHPLTIGPLRLQNNLCLAPMAGSTDRLVLLTTTDSDGRSQTRSVRIEGDAAPYVAPVPG